MKSSQILASVLFGSFAAAVPFKRDLVTKTEVLFETVVVYTTVWDDETPVAEATTTAGADLYKHRASSVEAKPTISAAPTNYANSTTQAVYTSSAVQEPSSIYTPVQTPSPSSTVVVVSSAAKPVETSSAPAPVVPTTTAAASTTEAAYTPVPVSSYTPAPVSSAAPAPAPSAPAPAPGGEEYSGDVTIYYNTGAYGACGTALYDTDMVVALAQPAWGTSSYDTATGEATNPWCGQKININANGKSITATIMDLCPGCTGHDIDLSKAAWEAIGMTEDTRIKGTWSKAS